MINLIERLLTAERLVEDKNLPPVQKEILDKQGSGVDLVRSTFPGEGGDKKFLILNNGSVIKVERSHFETVIGEPESSFISAKDDKRRFDLDKEFSNSGGIRGRIRGRKIIVHRNDLLNDAQIESVMLLYRKYHCTEALVDIGGNWDDFTPKSGEQLRAVLKYGTEMLQPVGESAGPELMDKLLRVRNIVEAVGLPPVQKEIRDRVPPSTTLPRSTWSGEENWLKFLILNNGDVIPVESSHLETIVGSDDPRDVDPHDLISGDFMDSGGVRGGIRAIYDLMHIESHKKYNLIYIQSHKKLTDKQIDSVLVLYKKYKAEFASLAIGDDYVDFEPSSRNQLDAVLKYGTEMLQPVGESVGSYLVEQSSDYRGWIDPDGKIHRLRWNETHDQWAEAETGIETPKMGEYDTEKLEKSSYMKLINDGWVRFDVDSGGVNIESGKTISEEQFKILVKFYRDYRNPFYFDITNKNADIIKSGEEFADYYESVRVVE